MGLNNFLPFCPTDTGTNLDTQSDYAAAADRTSGNQPGIAKSKLNNKALRQGTYVASQIAQFLADTTATDVLDDATPLKLLGQIRASLMLLPPLRTVYSSGSGTHNCTYFFFINTGSATNGATYTNNSITFTVNGTIASATILKAKGSGAPLASGTLTKTGGTGDTTISFYAVRAPLQLQVKMCGGGGGGGQSGASGTGTQGGDGNGTTFGAWAALGGLGSVSGGAGGVGGVTSGAGATYSLQGGPGGGGMRQPATPGAYPGGGNGGSTPFGGAGSNGGYDSNGRNASGNTGGGGGGGGGNDGTASNLFTGGGGGAGGYLEAEISNPAGGYAYSIGTGGAAGIAGTNGFGGGTGAAGLILVQEIYQ